MTSTAECSEGLLRSDITKLIEYRFLLSLPIELPEKGCWLWQGRLVEGYGVISTGKEGEVLRAARVSYAFYKGDIPPAYLVRHRCDNKACVFPGHLILGSHADNMFDRMIPPTQRMENKP